MDSFTDEIDNKIIDMINRCKPDILWVGLSAPKQEKWIYKNIDKLNIKMACGIGAVFNFYSGYVKRAPKWMQKIGLEWFYRIIAEPKRLLKKYLVYNTKFILLVFRDIFGRVFRLK
ncbi:N-acetylglucosaminyldiphosphoundecaprenol N-acetyl-beta-D-mannosaminyltransferase [subsurface metagenome]